MFFNGLGAVRQLRALAVKKIARLLQLAQTILDKTGSSIFMKNFRLILRKSTTIIPLAVQVKSPLFSLRGYEKTILQRLRAWAASIRKGGVVVIMRARLTASAAGSLMSLMESAQKYSKRDRLDFVCPCRSLAAEGFLKVGNHVMQPMMEVAQRHLPSMPNGWTARSKLIPDYDECMMKVKQSLDAAHEKLEARLEKRGQRGVMANVAKICWEAAEPKLRQHWEGATKQFGGAWVQSQLQQLRRALRPFVVAPVDKLPSDALVMCPVAWSDKVMSLTKEMRRMTVSEFSDTYDRLFFLGARILELPYSSLNRHFLHEYPSLK